LLILDKILGSELIYINKIKKWANPW